MNATAQPTEVHPTALSMASAMIDGYAETRSVTAADLQRAGFSAQDITEHGDEARAIADKRFVRQAGDDPVVLDSTLAPTRRHPTHRDVMNGIAAARQDRAVHGLPLNPSPADYEFPQPSRAPADDVAQAAVECRPAPERRREALAIVCGLLPGPAETHMALRVAGFSNAEIAALWPDIISTAADDFEATLNRSLGGAS